MLWIVYGHRGWIGGMVIDYIKSCPEYLEKDDQIHLGQARLENYQALDDEIDQASNKYQGKAVVLSFTGRTHGPGCSTIDYLESRGKLPENLRDNLLGPMNLADVCFRRGLYYTCLGTGCIYKFESSGPHTIVSRNGFTETDIPNFDGSAYSAVKGVLDQLITRYPNVLLLRIRLPVVGYSHPRNLVSKLLKYKKVMTGIPNAISVLPTLFPIMIYMARNEVSGCYNFVNPGDLCHDEILEMYKKLVDPNIKWESFTEEEQNKVMACPRSNTCLDTSKLESYCEKEGLQLLDLPRAVDQVLRSWK